MTYHPGGQDKDANVADMVRSGSAKDAILREIARCRVLCPN